MKFGDILVEVLNWRHPPDIDWLKAASEQSLTEQEIETVLKAAKFVRSVASSIVGDNKIPEPHLWIPKSRINSEEASAFLHLQEQNYGRLGLRVRLEHDTNAPQIDGWSITFQALIENVGILLSPVVAMYELMLIAISPLYELHRCCAPKYPEFSYNCKTNDDEYICGKWFITTFPTSDASCYCSRQCYENMCKWLYVLEEDYFDNQDNMG